MGDASTELVTALDAGHGGKHNGAMCYRGILREADLNIAVAKAAKRRRPELFLLMAFMTGFSARPALFLFFLLSVFIGTFRAGLIVRVVG